MDFVRAEVTERGVVGRYEEDVNGVLEGLLERRPARLRRRRTYEEWRAGLSVEDLFGLTEKYASYRYVESATRRAVARLPRRQSQVIEDYYLEQMTSGEIAARMGVTKSTVGNHRHQGIGNLRRDDDLFIALSAVGTVRDLARRESLARRRQLEQLARPAA